MLTLICFVTFFSFSHSNGDKGFEIPQELEEYYSTLPPLPNFGKGHQYQCSDEAICVERAQCFYVYSLGINIIEADVCQLANEEVGVCCPLVTDIGDDFVPHVDDDKYEESKHKFAENYLEAIDRVYEERLQFWKIKNGFLHQDYNPGYHTKSVIYDQAQVQIIKHYGLEQSASLYRILWNSSLNVTCHAPPRCYHSPYRSIDGTCNNLKHPIWGSSNSGFNRRIPPRYSDGMDLPRVSKDGFPLPLSRHLSLTLSREEYKAQYSISQMVTAFGQFVSHDIAETPNEIEDDPHLEDTNCCRDYHHPFCMPISVPKGDLSYQSKNITCLNLVRSKALYPENCQIGEHREQINEVTSYIDGSTLYGSTEDVEHEIRAFKNGLLKISSLHEHQYLPLTNLSSKCGNKRKGIRCFVSGDDRSNQNPGIVCMHTIWLREHNAVAKTLSRLNPHWDDETVYQETRKIVIAEIQHVTYNEYLPLLLDFTTRKRHNLFLKPFGYSHNYSPELKANIMNEFSTAAFRMGHSMVHDHIPLIRNDKYVETIKLEQTFFNPELFYDKYKLEMVLEGLTSDSAQVVDRYFASGLTQTLFKSHLHNKKGTDLLSINIQRGRDHGIAGYNEWRQLCGLKFAVDFEDLLDVISDENVDYLRNNYKSVDDIDLYVAGVLEQHVVGSVLGPTFSCVIADQFRRLKQGDRFWYERYSEKEMVGFSPEQLQEMRKVTLAGILCENTHIKRIQPLVFIKPGLSNKKVPCDSDHIQQRNLLPWLHRV